MTELSTTSAPLPEASKVIERIAILKQQLEMNAPGYESILHEIHRALVKDPETVHVLTEDQIGIICSGLAKKTNIVIATQVAKSAKVSDKKKYASVSADDL